MQFQSSGKAAVGHVAEGIEPAVVGLLVSTLHVQPQSLKKRIVDPFSSESDRDDRIVSIYVTKTDVCLDSPKGCLGIDIEGGGGKSFRTQEGVRIIESEFFDEGFESSLVGEAETLLNRLLAVLLVEQPFHLVVKRKRVQHISLHESVGEPCFTFKKTRKIGKGGVESQSVVALDFAGDEIEAVVSIGIPEEQLAEKSFQAKNTLVIVGPAVAGATSLELQEGILVGLFELEDGAARFAIPLKPLKRRFLPSLGWCGFVCS